MSIDELNDVLYKWVNQVLNIDNRLNISIIIGNQNTPRPSIPYIVIGNPPINNRKVNRGNWCDRTDTNGDMEYLIRYQALIRLQSIGDNGKYLNFLQETLNFESIKTLFRNSLVSVISNENIVDLTGIDEHQIEKRASMDINVIYTNADFTNPNNPVIKKQQVGYIETVEIEPTYEH